MTERHLSHERRRGALAVILLAILFCTSGPLLAVDWSVPSGTLDHKMVSLSHVAPERAAARVLERVGWPRAAAPEPTDMTPAHLDYDAVERALGAGVMGLTPSGAFEPWRSVSGMEALEVVDSLARLAGS